MIAPADVPATLTQRSIPWSRAASSAPTRAIPFTPPPSKTPSAASVSSGAAGAACWLDAVIADDATLQQPRGVVKAGDAEQPSGPALPAALACGTIGAPYERRPRGPPTPDHCRAEVRE